MYVCVMYMIIIQENFCQTKMNSYQTQDQQNKQATEIFTTPRERFITAMLLRVLYQSKL